MSNKKKGPVTELAVKLSEAEQMCAEYRDSALRAAADFDNYRRRTQQELVDARRRGLEAVLCDLVPVLDNFERALAATDEVTVESVRKGIELIRKQLRVALEGHGLAEYTCVGEQFDPRRAEAVGFEQSDDQEPDTVIAEECRGYRCGERVIRPARVIVARPTAARRDSMEKPAQGTEAEAGMMDC